MGSAQTNWYGRSLTRVGPMSRRRALGLALAALALVFAAGCSNNPYPAGESTRSTMYFATSDDPKTLDPTAAAYIDDIAIIAMFYSSYYRYHYLKRDPFALELNLGAEQPRREPCQYAAREQGRLVQKQGESWTFRIKRGLRFQDDPCFPGGKGREVTAADFLFAFRRMADPAVNCPNVGWLADKIVGFPEYLAYCQEREKRGLGMDYQRPVEGLQQVPGDRYAFRLILNQPYPQLRYLMSMAMTAPLAHEAVARYGKDLARHPVGCGAYVLAEYTPKLRIVLKVNPNRPRELYPSEGMPGDREAGLLRDAGKPLPLTDTIVYTVTREGITGWNQFLQGYQDGWGVTQQNFQQVLTRQGTLSEAMKRRGVTLHTSPDIAVYYYMFNMHDPVVGGYTPQKRKLRQAISCAFDSQAFIDLTSQGVGIPAQFILPPGLFGYDPDYRNPYQQHDIGKAKRLLAEAGYPGGIDPKTGERLTIYFDNSATTAGGRQMVGLLAKQFEALGIHLESRTWRANVLIDKIDTRQYQFAYLGWIVDYPDPEDFLLLLYGPNAQNRGPNAWCYENPAYDRLFEKMRAMDDGPERLAIIRKMRDIAVEDCPLVYEQHPVSRMLTHDWVSNVKLHPIALDAVKYRRIDGPLRARQQAEWNRPNYWPAVAGAALLIAGSLPAVRVVRRRRHRRARRRPGGPH